MKIANEGHINAHFVELIANVRNSFSSFRGVDSQAHHLRTRQGQFLDLDGGTDDIHRVCVGHRLNPDRCISPHSDDALPPLNDGLQTAARQR